MAIAPSLLKSYFLPPIMPTSTISPHWLCPNLREHWILGRDRTTGTYYLKARQSDHRHALSDAESYALSHFSGRFTVAQIQRLCERELDDVPADFIQRLWQKLTDWGVLSLDELTESKAPPYPNPKSPLKPNIQWIHTDDGHWILRNPDDVTFMQVNDLGKQIIEQLGMASPAAIAQEYNLSASEIKLLMQQLTLTAMLKGTTPPKPPKKKFTPLKLLFFKLPLWNPDAWLGATIDRIQWIWTKRFWWMLCFILAGTVAIALHQRAELLWTAQTFLAHLNIGIILSFGILALVVVMLHELGHAFTLKHYGGIVPEVGLMFMALMPIAYTNTTDQYALPKRSQRMLVVGAGVLCQLIIATIAFWLWNSSASGSWLWTLSYLLFAASIFTVAINLNPLAKFDGYYLAVAATGINNLRQRSFDFYKQILQFKPSAETGRDRWILALYAPLSFLYILSVFGFLFLKIAGWILTVIPFTALVLFLIWATYYYLAPDPS